MLNLLQEELPRRKCDGSSRREFLQVGTLGLFGLTLPELLRARAAAAVTGKPVKDTSVILLFLDGGASQFETFDPKMDVPKEYRSLFGVTKTKLPGVLFDSHFSKMGQIADRMAVLRTLTHADGDHGGATHWMKTGHPWPPAALAKRQSLPSRIRPWARLPPAREELLTPTPACRATSA